MFLLWRKQVSHKEEELGASRVSRARWVTLCPTPPQSQCREPKPLQIVWGAGHHSPCRAHPGWAPRAEPTREKSAAAEGRCLSPPDHTGLELGRMRVICSSFCSSHKFRTPDWASQWAGPWQGQRLSTGDVGWPPAAPSARRETDPRGVGSGNHQDTGDLLTPLMCSLSSMLGESGRG